MSRHITSLAVTAALLLLAPAAIAKPMSGAFAGHVDDSNVGPAGGDMNHLSGSQTASGSNRSPGSPLDGAQVSIQQTVDLDRGRGPVDGTITFTTAQGSTTSPYHGTVATDAQGRVTSKGRFTTNQATGAFEGLTGAGTFSVVYSSQTDFTGRWQGTFRMPGGVRTSRR